MDFDMPKSVGPPDVNLWMSVYDSNSYDFMLKWKPYYQNFLYKTINFMPGMRFQSM